MKKLLLAIIRESFENPTVTGCFVMPKPDSDPPYQPVGFESAEHIVFKKALGDVSDAVVLKELKKMGHNIERTTFSV